MTIFGSLEIGRSALLAHQYALDITGHNITNMNTTGYTRQRAILETQVPEILPGIGYLGRGVKIEDVERLYNSYIEAQILRESSTLSYFQSKEELYTQLEGIFNEFQGASLSEVSGAAEDSLSGILNQFWAAWQDVADNPESLSARSALVVQGQTLCATVQKIVSDLNSVKTELNAQLPHMTEEVNSILSEIASLNQQIYFPETAGLSPNDLKDRRDQLIKDLSAFMDVRTIEDANGVTNVLVGGDVVVQGQYCKQLELVQDNPSDDRYTLRWADNHLTPIISNGKLKTLFDTRDTTIPELIGSMNDVFAQIVDDVNALHRLGMGLNGSSRITGANQFTGTLAANATVGINGTTVNLLAGDTLVNIRDRINMLTGTHGIQASIDNNRLVLSPIDDTHNVLITSDINNVMLDLGIVCNFFKPYSSKDFAASTMEIDATVLQDPLKIAASLTGAPGNNAQALAIADLQNQFTMTGDTITYAEFYRRLLTGFGAETAMTHQLFSNQQLLVSKLTQQRESSSGVNLDDELVNMVKYQKGYQSAAKVVTTIDEMLNTVLGLKR